MPVRPCCQARRACIDAFRPVGEPVESRVEIALRRMREMMQNMVREFAPPCSRNICFDIELRPRQYARVRASMRAGEISPKCRCGDSFDVPRTDGCRVRCGRGRRQHHPRILSARAGPRPTRRELGPESGIPANAWRKAQMHRYRYWKAPPCWPESGVALRLRARAAISTQAARQKGANTRKRIACLRLQFPWLFEQQAAIEAPRMPSARRSRLISASAVE